MQVKDSTKALQAIAASHRSNFKIPVICVTGSNGKTTVKDMIGSALSAKYNVLKNEGTKNNHIGVPQTLLKLKDDHDACVLELGTNHRGEIKALADIAKPDIAVITNVGPSHLEFLEDLEGVYEEKSQILGSLGRRGFAVLNGDDEFLSRIEGARIIKYGFKPQNDIRAEIRPLNGARIGFLVNGRDLFQLNLFGAHNVYNALAAIAVSLTLGVGNKAIGKALAAHRPASMRLDRLVINGVEIINDSYNSNPLSMKAALQAIRDYPARARWVVSGDMLELGADAARLHEMIGELVATCAVEGLLTFGELSKHTISGAMKCGMDKGSLWHCESHGEIAGILRKVVKEGDLVLVKGSRSMRMESVIEKFKG
jgi:UDP-N-acetylmuramoyl-tripeptide--D-alanyl-D-alanine ligase